jgi:hypothetical protein
MVLSQIKTRSHTLSQEHIINDLQKQIQILQDEKKQTQNELQNLMSKYSNLELKLNTKWVDDEYIEAHFKCFSKETEKYRNDILFIGPTTSQLLKHGNLYDNLFTLTSLSFDTKQFVFICVNNCDEIQNEHKLPNNSHFVNVMRGSHWSLLLLNRSNQTFYHFDSIQNFNQSFAKQVASNIAENFKFENVKTIQQFSNFECGVHLLVNAKSILNDLLINNQEYFDGVNNLSNILKPPKNKNNILKDSENHNDIQQICHSPPNTFTQYKTNDLSAFPNTATTKSKGLPKIDNYKVKCHNRFTKLCEEDHGQVVEDMQIVQETPHKSKKIKQQPQLKPHIKYPLLLTSHSPFIHNNSNDNLNKCKNKITVSENNNSKDESETARIDNNITQPIECNLKRIKILADSHGRSLRQLLYNKLDDSFNVSGVIMPNGKINNILSIIENEAVTMSKQDYIVVIGGTNDVNGKLNVNEFCTDIESKLKTLTNTNVILSAIPYRHDIKMLNKKIKHINYQLQKLTAKWPHITFLPLHDLRYYHYTSYGLHLNKTGKTLYCSLIYKSMENFLSKRIPVQITQRNSFLGKIHLNSIQPS